MTDADIKEAARRWLPAVRRGDISPAYAALALAGAITYPYADQARWDHVHRLVSVVFQA